MHPMIQASLSSMLCLPDAVFYERFPSTYKRPPRAYNISVESMAARGPSPYESASQQRRRREGGDGYDQR